MTDRDALVREVAQRLCCGMDGCAVADGPIPCNCDGETPMANALVALCFTRAAELADKRARELPMMATKFGAEEVAKALRALAGEGR